MGPNPLEMLEWFEDDERVQVFIKLPRSVLIADFIFKEDAVNNEIELKSTSFAHPIRYLESGVHSGYKN